MEKALLAQLPVLALEVEVVLEALMVITIAGIMVDKAVYMAAGAALVDTTAVPCIEVMVALERVAQSVSSGALAALAAPHPSLPQTLGLKT